MKAALPAWLDSNRPLNTFPNPPSPTKLASLKFRVAAASCRRVNPWAKAFAPSGENAAAVSNSAPKSGSNNYEKSSDNPISRRKTIIHRKTNRQNRMGAAAPRAASQSSDGV